MMHEDNPVIKQMREANMELREDGYYQIVDGQQFEVEHCEIIRFKCCDCGLVHKVAVAIEHNGNIGIAMEREADGIHDNRQEQG